MAGIHAAPIRDNAPYMHSRLLELTDGVLRPGGLETTRQGLSQCRLTPGARVLDLGCGTGQTTMLLRREYQCVVTGLDQATRMLSAAAQLLPGTPLVQGTADALPFLDQSFDAVTCECVLSLTQNPKTSLGEIQRVLKDTGVLLLSDIYLRSGYPAPPPRSIHSCATRAMPMEHVLSMVQDTRFSLQACSELTQHLKQLAGEIIFSCGSLDAFWEIFLGPEKARETCSLLSKAKLGYYQLIARKQSGRRIQGKKYG